MEACGVILKDNRWIPCKNVAEDPYNDFKISPEEFIGIKNIGEVAYIVHSHPDSPCNPSPKDVHVCNVMGIPFLIISYPSMDSFTLYPEITPLLGRSYSFGELDCLQLAMDYYKELGLVLPERPIYLDNWDKRGEDYFSLEHITEYWGFRRVANRQEGDLLIFSVKSSVGNHCGVYIGKDFFIHHAINRLSCRESLYPMWGKFITGIYRYEKKHSTIG